MASDNNPIMTIPIAILIFENDGIVTYRSYSPIQYHFRPDGSNPDHNDDQYGRFLAHVHNCVAYNQNDPLNNITNYGRLKEIHIRHIQTPNANRGNVCYFTTYINPHTSYKPVHRESPIFFDRNQANNYANTQPNLCHRDCTHEFV